MAKQVKPQMSILPETALGSPREISSHVTGSLAIGGFYCLGMPDLYLKRPCVVLAPLLVYNIVPRIRVCASEPPERFWRREQARGRLLQEHPGEHLMSPFGVSDPLCPLLFLAPPFSNYSFLVHHPG
jgi:hypothetical protein